MRNNNTIKLFVIKNPTNCGIFLCLKISVCNLDFFHHILNLRFGFEEIPNIEVEYAVSINENPEETFYRSSPKVNLDYYFLNGFALTADYTLNNYYNKSKTINNQFDFLNASLAYQKKDSKWEYRLSATNLLNTKTRNSDFFNQFSIVTSQYWIQPRYVIFTLKYNL